MEIGAYGNFGGYVNGELKGAQGLTGRELGQAVSQAAHERNELRKAAAVDEAADPTSGSEPAVTDSSAATSSGDVTLSAASEPALLTLKVVSENLNEALQGLQPDPEQNLIQLDSVAQVEPTAQAVAEQILALATSPTILETFQQANPDTSESDLIVSLTEVLTQGVVNGFAEVRTVLEQMGALDDEAAATVDSIYTLVKEGIDAFLTSTDSAAAPLAPSGA